MPWQCEFYRQAIRFPGALNPRISNRCCEVVTHGEAIVMKSRERGKLASNHLFARLEVNERKSSLFKSEDTD
jgi:hypothetical protein